MILYMLEKESKTGLMIVQQYSLADEATNTTLRPASICHPSDVLIRYGNDAVQCGECNHVFRSKAVREAVRTWTRNWKIYKSSPPYDNTAAEWAAAWTGLDPENLEVELIGFGT